MRHITGMLIEVSAAKEWGDTCHIEGHTDRPAVKTLVGETDSWGSEYHPMCQECVDAYKAKQEAEDENPTGTCDWCHKSGLRVHFRSDPTEGGGSVYEVCNPCYIRAVHNEYDDDWE